MATSPVLYVYYRPDNDDSYPGVPNRHITEADWASFTIAQRRTIENATTQEGYTRRKVWVHRDLVDETEQERAEREAREQAAREAYERGNSLVRYREIENVLATVDAVAGVPARMDAVEQIVSEFVSPADLPTIPGLYFHLDAQAITATDGSRIEAWTDTVSGVVASQADTAKQPRYGVTALNGKPGVVFENARNDALVTSTVAPTSLAATVFLVMVGSPPTSGGRYAFGTNQSGTSVRNVYISSIGLGLQGNPVLSGSITMTRPRIATALFNGEDSALRVDGTQLISGTTGVATVPPTVFTIGHRHAQTAGNGFEGAIGEVLYYDRALTANECRVVESYLAARWGIPVTTQRTWHVDTVFGTPTGSGRTEATAMDKLSTALASIHAANAQDATIIVYAPETHPIRETAAYHDYKTGGTIRVRPRTPGEKWHLYGSQKFTSGWTSAGGGVYTRAVSIPLDRDPFAYVPTLLDQWGQPTRIFTRNTATPTTPAAGEYGYSGGTYYLHLPGDADPNQHTVEIATAVNLVLVTQGTTVTLTDGVIRGAQSPNVSAGSSGGAETGAGTVYATDCISEYTTEAWRTGGYVTGMYLTRCIGRYASNDGFNHHCVDGVNAPIMELIDCEGAWNDDEGVSPHETARLILRGGVYHHNGHGGLTSVGSAITQLSGTEFHHNRVLDDNVTAWDMGGVSILQASKLISTDLYSHDHPGPGVEIDTAGGATWTDNGGTRSGTAHGNGAEDVV